MKFLCLHGAYTNPEAMREQLEPIVDGLMADGLATFYYPKAPLEGPPTQEMEDSMGLIPEPPHYRWLQWQPVEHSIAYLPSPESLETALEYVDREITATAGPFDAVIGFSEGAALATGLAMRHPDRYRCLVLFSGFGVRENTDTVLPMPSLHVMSMQDPMAEAGTMLYSCFDPEKARIVHHMQGHIIPSGSKNVERLSKAIRQLVVQSD